MSSFVSSWAAGVLLRLAPQQRAEVRGARFLKLAAEARSRIEEISPREAFALLKETTVLVDVREREEFQRGHIPDALHLARGIAEFEIEARYPNTSGEILLYCGAGNRSALVADSLRRMGYSQVRTIAGGFKAWLEAGFPAWHGRRALDD